MSGDPYEDSWVYRNDDGSWNEPGEDADEDDGTYSVFTSGAPYPLCGVAVSGCTDETAFNYNPNATSDDGSCEAVVEGCTNISACNYNSESTIDDNSCFYPDEPFLNCFEGIFKLRSYAYPLRI